MSVTGDDIESRGVRPAAGTADASEGSVGRYLKAHLRDYGMLVALVAIMAFFQVTTDGVLMKPVNLANLFQQNSYIVVMALGMLLVIVAGHIDLSVGSVVGFVGALAAVMLVHWKLPVALVIPACLVAGALIGMAQGYWIAYWRIPSFIVTLAGMLVFKGLTLWLLAGQSVGPFPTSFQRISTGFVPEVLPHEARFNLTALVVGLATVATIVALAWHARTQRARHGIEDEPLGFFVAKHAVTGGAILYVAYLLATYRGLPNVLIWMALLTALYTFVTNRTTLGRRIYALGGNEKAAQLSGVRTQRLVFLTFANMGMLAALAGLIFAGAAEHGDAQGGRRVRARRHRRGVHRRRVHGGRRRAHHRRRRGRADHGGHEQRHVHHGHRHRLAAGHQGSGAARRRGVRRVQPRARLMPRAGRYPRIAPPFASNSGARCSRALELRPSSSISQPDSTSAISVGT